MRAGIRFGALIGLVALFGCATVSDPMRAPIDAADENRFHASLASLESMLEPDEFAALQDALAVLLVTDVESDSRTEFFRTRIDGRTPRKLIETAREKRDAYGIARPPPGVRPPVSG